MRLEDAYSFSKGKFEVSSSLKDEIQARMIKGVDFEEVLLMKT